MRGLGLATWCDRIGGGRGACRAFLPSLLLLLVASSCGDDATSVPDARPGYDAHVDPVVPWVETAACRFDFPNELGLTEGADYECGDLIVYEDRDAASGRTIKLHYLRIFSSGSSTNATVWLAGGPGDNGNVWFRWIDDHLGPEVLNDLVDGLLVDGDFLSLAQRGTPLSEPALTSLDSNSLSEIADLPSYNTAFNADDVDDLRSTLGYDQLNLYGRSYGSRLALEVMRRHGEHLRSSMIAGVLPPQFNCWASEATTFYGAITTLDAACAEAGDCSSVYGDLVAKLLAGVDSLNDEVLTFAPGVTFDGDDFVRLLWNVMYDGGTYPKLPMVISDVAERRTDRVGETIAAWSAALGMYASESARGVWASVMCGEWFNPPDESAFDEVSADVPASIRQAFTWFWEGNLGVCARWPVGPPRPDLSQPVTSAVRTLVVSGAMDPMTPPSSGDLAASTLSNREVVVFPASGHLDSLLSPCGLQISLDFLADPDQALDTSCAASEAIDFELPSKRKPWTAADQARLVSALRHAPLRLPLR